jgi:POT family proton-dependent oligopeptide transporter
VKGAGYPKGAWLIIAVETCERFSFYGMLAILVLFLTADPTRGGFRWTDGEALGLLGAYTGLMYALPAFGGYLADHVWGNRRAVSLGASFMVLGHFTMAVPAAVPAIVARVTGVPVRETLIGLGVPLGKLVLPAALGPALAAVRAGPHGAETAAAVLLAYRLIAASFFTAIALLVVGNALMKSTLVVMVGDLFAEGDPQRDGAYAYYYLGISLGAFASGIVVGFVAERFGWHFGFTVAGVFMAIALSLYRGLGPRLLGDVGRVPKARLAPKAAARTADRQAPLRIGILFVLAMILLVFEIGWYQLYGTWSLFVDRSVDRSVAGFTIPVPWFTAFNALMVIVVTPSVARLLVRLESAGRWIDIALKYAVALTMVALAQLALAGAGHLAGGAGRSGPILPLVAVTLLSLGELAAWPSTYGTVYRLAPAGLVAAAVGAWYLLTLGAGGYLAGLAGQLTDGMTPAGRFTTLAAVMAVGAVGTLALRPVLARLARTAGTSL